MLPGSDGMELMKGIREVSDVPVIFLSPYGQDEVVARAFGMGAADYAVKPFSPTELAARIRAALRKRAASEPSEPYVLGDLTIDYAERRVTLAGRPLPLIAMEYRLLAELSANAGRLLTCEHLLERVWGEKSSGDVRPMRTIVSKLRRKLGDDADNPTYIFTEPRVGYRMPKGETHRSGSRGYMLVSTRPVPQGPTSGDHDPGNRGFGICSDPTKHAVNYVWGEGYAVCGSDRLLQGRNRLSPGLYLVRSTRNGDFAGRPLRRPIIWVLDSLV